MTFKRTPELRRISHMKYVAKPDTRQKLRCREQCAYAVRTGKLVRQSCEQCGDAATQAHHDDYSKPLSVRWLCRPCHCAAHRKTHCQRGHALTPENRREGGRCLQCHILGERKRYAKRRLKVSADLIHSNAARH